MSTSSKDRYYSTTSIGKSRRSSPSELQSHPFTLPTGQGTFPNSYTAPRSSPGRGYDINPQALYQPQWQSGNSPHLPPAFPSYDTTSGSVHERHSPQANYTTFSNRAASPPVLGQMESRRAPLLSSSPGGDRWQQSANYGMPAVHGYPANAAANLRSPSANYPNHYMHYTSGSQSSSYTYVPTYDEVPLTQQDHGFDEMDSVHISQQQQQRPVSPYNIRGGSHSHPSPPPISPTTADEPAIKKKRKRADAHQLKVLNETYARTAFPSTEERHALAKALDMSPRSVQIWFQNKRQSMRQTNRQSSTVSSSGHQQPPQFSMQGSQGGEMSHGYPSGSITLTESPYMGSSSAQDMARGHASLSSSAHRRVRSPEEADVQRWSRDHY